MNKLNFLEVVARNKLGASADWLMYQWEAIGETRDVLITGGVPVGRYSRGPRKGRPKWAGRGDRAVVTQAEERAAKAEYETETGNCSACQGDRQTWAGWHHLDGNRYRPCTRCNSTGIAPTTGAQP